jgi:uncharacterized membrane protein YeiH
MNALFNNLAFSQYAPWTFDAVAWISLIAATTNAFNGALLARRPDHYKNFTVMGIIILAYAGGIGGGVVRDVLVNKIPSPLLNPWYLIFCFAAAAAALLIDYYSAAKFKDGLFQFMTAFTLPWYAIVGVQTALDAKLGYIAAVIIGCIATTAGRWIIDVACNQTPKQLVRGEFFMVSAALTGIGYEVFNVGLGWNVVWATAIAFLIGFGFRLSAQTFGWEEWEPWEPAGTKAEEKARKRLGEGLRTEFKVTADE